MSSSPPLLVTRSASRRVMTDPLLLRAIASFQHGLPLVLYDFWALHDASVTSNLNPNLIHEHHEQLLALLAMRGGSIQLLDLLRDVRFGDYDHHGFCWAAPRLDRVVVEAVAHDRVDMIEWAITNGVVHSDPEEVWTEVIQCPHGFGSSRTLDVLYAAVPIDDQALQELITDDLEAVHSMAILQWITETNPGVALPPAMTTCAAARGDLAMVRYLHEYRAHEGCEAAAFHTALDGGQTDVLEYLLEHRSLVLTWKSVVALAERCDEGMAVLLRRFVHRFPPIPRHLVRRAVASADTYRLQHLFDVNIISRGSD